MNVLLLIGAQFGDAKKLSRRIHYDFICKLKDHCEFHTYGPGEDDPILSPLSFNSGRLFSKVLKYYTPDVVIVYSIFCAYRWLPGDFKDSSVPKICIEVDYWNVVRKWRSWYKDNHFTFIIQRGYYNRSPIRSVWLPFCANEEFIISSRRSIGRRKQRIAFVGRGGDISKDGYYYPIRREAIRKLHEHKLVENIGVVGHDDYPNSLSRYFCYLCDSGRFDSPPAKTFEIMAAGGLLFTTPFSGYKRLFDKEKTCFFYDRDLVDVVDRARMVYKMPIEQVEEIVERGKKHIYEKHTDTHRIEDLLEILSTYITQGNLIKKWGI